MGVVYKANDTRLGRSVALKFLSSHLSSSSDEIARFLSEAKVSSSLNHPNICTIYDIQEFNGQTFIVMEYVEGKTLRELKLSLTYKQIVDVILQTAEGLAAAHDKGIVHRDIKSDNIMLRPDGRAVIMDFGLAKLQGVTDHSRSGTTSGTTSYMSPEQIQGQEADARSDIFALGVVMYELLSGVLPFNGGHEAAVMYEIVNVDPPTLRSVKPDVDPELERIVAKCLEKEPGNRYQSVRDISVDLKRFKRDSGGRPQQPIAPPPVQTAAKRTSRWRMVIPATLLVLLLVAISWWVTGRKHAESFESLAVLPFENSGGDQSMEYLSDGISESIIISLTKIPDLRVVPRSTAFRLRGSDPQEAGTKLKVQTVLTGRILKQGDALTITVDLIDVEKQSQLWGQQYHRTSSDLSALQGEISSDVSARLRQGLSGDVKKNIAKQYTTNPEAYRLYLQGRYFWSKRRAAEILKAIDCFKQAIALDPSYALAYIGLADSYLISPQYAGSPAREEYPKAIAAATRALEIDNSLAEAHATLGFANYAMWNWNKAEEEFKVSFAMNPNYPTTYHWYAILLQVLGRYDEQLAAIKHAQELDPLSQVIGGNVGIAYMMLGRNEESIRQLDAVLAIDSTFGLAWYRRVIPLIRLGKLREAHDAALKGVEYSGRSSEALSFLGYINGIEGNKRDATRIATELETRFHSHTSPGYYIARTYIGMGDLENALKWLNVDFDDHSGSLIWLSSEPEWEPYRSDTRFTDILKKIGLKK
jgi:serine/threonine-protein kinase